MKKKLVVTYEIDTNDVSDVMEAEDITFEEAVDQLLTDGELELNELMILDYKVEDGEE